METLGLIATWTVATVSGQVRTRAARVPLPSWYCGRRAGERLAGERNVRQGRGRSRCLQNGKEISARNDLHAERMTVGTAHGNQLQIG